MRGWPYLVDLLGSEAVLGGELEKGLVGGPGGAFNLDCGGRGEEGGYIGHACEQAGR
jgi:hypothetical protein